MFKRLANLWKGFLSLWISDIEKEHPEIAYENAINSMVGKYAKLKSATAAIIRRREELDDRYKKANAELAQAEAEPAHRGDRGAEGRSGVGALRRRFGEVLPPFRAIRNRQAQSGARLDARE